MLSYTTAYAAMKVVLDMMPADFDALGITRQDFELLTQKEHWVRPHMPKVMRTINSLLYGTLEVMGMPKITIPSEYVAAAVTIFIAPANRLPACVWLSQEHRTGVNALELSARQERGGAFEFTSADSLFALVGRLTGSNAYAPERARFMTKIGLAVEAEQGANPAQGRQSKK